MENPGNYEKLLSLWVNKAILNVSDYLEEKRIKKDSESQCLIPNNSNLFEKIFNRRIKILKVREIIENLTLKTLI